jgi:hypothetical protein
VRVRRRGGDAGADHSEALPERIRSPHSHGSMPAARRVARTAGRTPTAHRDGHPLVARRTASAVSEP